MEGMSRKRKLFVTVSVVGVVAVLGVFGTFAAFTATTTNANNNISSGTVKIDQHSGAVNLYAGTNKKPSDTITGCIRVTYTGSLASTVKLYTPSTITNGTNYTLTVDRDTDLTAPAADMNCTGFNGSGPAATSVYSGDLGAFPTTYAGGSDGKASGAAWAQNDYVDYKFTVTVKDDTTANAHTTNTFASGNHSFVWEARNN